MIHSKFIHSKFKINNKKSGFKVVLETAII